MRGGLAKRSLTTRMLAAFCLATLSMFVLVSAAVAQERRQAARTAPVVAHVITQVALRSMEGEPHLVIDASADIRPHIGVMQKPRGCCSIFYRRASSRSLCASMPARETVREIRFGAFMLGQGRIIVELNDPAHVDEVRSLRWRAEGIVWWFG